jgi:hypothetical protein
MKKIFLVFVAITSLFIGMVNGFVLRVDNDIAQINKSLPIFMNRDMILTSVTRVNRNLVTKIVITNVKLADMMRSDIIHMQVVAYDMICNNDFPNYFNVEVILYDPMGKTIIDTTMTKKECDQWLSKSKNQKSDHSKTGAKSKDLTE